MIKAFIKNSFQFKTLKRNDEKHLSNYYIAFKQTERRHIKYFKNLIIKILRITIWTFKNYILNYKKRKKTRKAQKPTFEFSISLKIYMIKIIFFTQLIKNLKINLFIVIIINIEKILKKKPYSNSTTLLFEKYQDFLNVFSREKTDKIFLYRFNNYKIDIIFEKKFDFGFIYEISQNKFKIFKKYLNDNLVIKNSFI